MNDLISWAAARARTIVATTKSVRLDVAGRSWELAKHSVTPSGQLIFVPPQEARDELAALGGLLPMPQFEAVLADVASVPQPARVRGWVHLRGTVTPADPGPRLRRFLAAEPGTPILTLTPRRILLDWQVQDQPVAMVTVRAEHYENTAPDALAGWESAWTSHLFDHHPGVVQTLARQALPDLSSDARVVPLLADGRGLVLRAYDGDVHDVRIDFDHPVRSGQEAIHALDRIVGGVHHAHED